MIRKTCTNDKKQLCILSSAQVLFNAGGKSSTAKIFSGILSTFLFLTKFKIICALSSYGGNKVKCAENIS